MFFLVTGKVSFTPYMGRTREENVTRLVVASDETEAEYKFRNHFESKSIPNDDSYSVYNVEVLETIV